MVLSVDPDPSPFFLLATIVQPFQVELTTPLVGLLVLLLASSLISGSEVAFFSLQPAELLNMKQSDKTQDKATAELLEKPKTLLATILISNNFINVAIILLSTFISAKLFNFSAHPALGFLINVVSITLLILLFGEVLPKVYASQNPRFYSVMMTYPMTVLRRIFHPMSRLLVKSTQIIERRMHNTAENLSVDDLDKALEITSAEGADQDEQRILKGIVKFGNTQATQIMKPRLDVLCVDKKSDYHRILEVIRDCGYSRIPVYEGNIDTIKGILYIKDLLPYLEEERDFEWQHLVRDAFFVPESKKIDDLLKEFQGKKIHLAVVVDEYGGTSGIITLEDVIEEIVGEISDEFDDEELVYSKLDENTYIFEGKIHLKDFFKVLDTNEEPFEKLTAEADTLAGFLLEVAGKFPEKDQEIQFENFTFKVESLEGRRIKRIKVTRHAPEALDE